MFLKIKLNISVLLFESIKEKYMKLFYLLTLFSYQALAIQVCNLESEIPASTPDTRFVDNGDGTITDIGTGLMWLKCPLGVSGNICEVGLPQNFTWEQALTEANISFLINYPDWRLPNIKELQSIVEQRCQNPSINTDFFPNPPNQPTINIWSSSTNAQQSNNAWYLSFNFGLSESESRSFPRQVRLVR